MSELACAEWEKEKKFAKKRNVDTGGKK